jgi:hypothetical protein
LAWTPRPNIVVIRTIGHLDVRMCGKIVEWTDLTLARGKSHVFHDMETMTSYEPAARQELTEYAEHKATLIDSVNVLFSSRLVAMGVAVANMVLGGALRTFGTRKTFEARIRELL